MLTLVTGEFYSNRRGSKVGPVIATKNSEYPFRIAGLNGGTFYTSDGRVYPDKPSIMDLVAPWVDPMATPAPVPSARLRDQPINLAEVPKTALALAESCAARVAKTSTPTTRAKRDPVEVKISRAKAYEKVKEDLAKMDAEKSSKQTIAVVKKDNVESQNPMKTSIEATSDHSGYEKLVAVLNDALHQASQGKGKDRHANDKPFDKQPIAEIGRMVGTGYNLGQAMKKAQEAQGMINRGEIDKASAELLGVIVYAASAVMLLHEQNS